MMTARAATQSHRSTMTRALPRTAAMLAILGAFALPAAGAAQEVEGTEPNRGGTIDLSAADPAVALQRLRPAEGFEVSLFASEEDFPIGKPVALAFDSRGRLWVSTMPSYPHYKPGEAPTDKLVILEDTDGDGRADKHTVFADSLYLALGFELGDGGVYISQEPNLVFLKDTDGDDRADERRILLHGFGTEDSHHAISAFTWDPGGALYFQEGTFLHSQVETPYGPVRLENAGVWRYEPHTEKLSVLTSYSFSNPWGHVFDGWGQNFIADASSGNNFFGLPISGSIEYPEKHPQMRVFTPVVRPTAGAEIVSSRHFPEEIQGNFLITNVIGFQGIKNHQIVSEGSGFTSREQPPLLTSSDINFRPIEMEFGPDGALYVTDWFNPLIGHMQYSLRDPRRDIEHGRIWRVTYPSRPLLEPVNLEALSVPELLDQLKVYEDRTRYRVRRELRERDHAEVARELERWIGRLDRDDAKYQHHLLEALWVQQSLDEVDPDLLARLLRAEDHRARAAATRVLRYSLHRVSAPLELLRPQVNDAHPLVRLEGVVALSFVPDPRAAEVALEALRHPLDYYLDYGLRETLAGLENLWKPVILSGQPFADDNPEGLAFLLDRLTPEAVAKVRRSEAVNEVLLSRAGVPLEVRRSALADLATQRGTARAAVLLQAIERADAGTGEGNADDELAVLLRTLEPAELSSVRDRVERLATSARLEPFREAAWAGMMRADGRVDRAWEMARRSDGATRDLLAGAAALEDPALAQALVPRIRELVESLAGGSDAASPVAVRGRYVRLEQAGCCETQSMAEVEVLDGRTNVALAGEARQKSTASGGEARRAIDGNTAGDFRLGSVSQSTTMEADPWWEVDLGEERPITAIRVWKRTDTAIDANMDGFTLRILDAAREPVRVIEDGDASGQPVRIDLTDDEAAETRRVALRTLIALHGADDQRLALFADLLRRGVDADLAVLGADTVLKQAGAPVADPSLAEALLGYARSIPSADRTGGSFTRAVELGRRVAAGLPADQQTRITRGFDMLLPKRLEILALEGAMRFDVEEFTVEPGREVEIVFRNPDVMPHNVVVTAPGAAEKVGRAADAMAADADAYARNFVPNIPEVLYATALVSPAERVTLSFQAPETPGEYPFICSFPGHWITMKGVMKVVGEAAP